MKRRKTMAKSATRAKSGPDLRSSEYRLESQVGHILRRVSQRARKNMLDRISEFGLTPMQTAAMTALFENGQTSQNRLGRLIGMEPSNVPGLVHRLRKKGLLELGRDAKNPRQYVLKLTPAGTTIVKKIIPHGHAATQRTLAPLTAEEKKTFLRILKKLM